MTSCPARARVERLLEWVLPVAEEIGAAPWLRLPERNAAERQIARRAEGASLEEIYAEQVGLTVPAPADTPRGARVPTRQASGLCCIIPRADAASASLCAP